MFLLRSTKFLGRNIKIICQNENGPCPLLAIANGLLLQNRISISDLDVIKDNGDAEYITLESLIQVVANLFIEAASRRSSDEMNHQLAVILEKLPKLADGLDLNVRFTNSSSFEFTEEISIFDGLDIPCLHGWCIDDQARDTRQVIEKMTYNQLMFKMVSYTTLLEKVDVMMKELHNNDAKIQERIKIYKKRAEDKKKNRYSTLKGSNSDDSNDSNDSNDNNENNDSNDTDYVHVSKEDIETTDTIDNDNTISENAVDEINRVKQLVSKWETLFEKKKGQKNFKVSIVDESQAGAIESNESVNQPQESNDNDNNDDDDDDAFAPVEMHPNDYIIASKIIDSQSLDLIAKAKLKNQLRYDKRIIVALSDEENVLLYSGPIIETFLEETSNQLTYYGLVSLHESMKERQVAAFFRNNHFSTILKYRGYIYSLVTDQGYSNEPSVVWELINEINGDTDYYNDQFEKPQIEEELLPVPISTTTADLQSNPTAVGSTQSIDNSKEELSEDYLIAKRLQEEEDRIAQNNRNVRPQNNDTVDSRWLREQERILSYYENNCLPAPQDPSTYPYQQYTNQVDAETARRNDEYYRQQYLRRIQREDPLLFQNMQNNTRQQPVATGSSDQKAGESSCSIQ